jgi:hypothetical protein
MNYHLPDIYRGFRNHSPRAPCAPTHGRPLELGISEQDLIRELTLNPDRNYQSRGLRKPRI